VIIGLRLTALTFFLNALTSVVPSAMTLVSSGGGKAFDALFLVVVLALGASFWFLAKPIARWVTRDLHGEVSLGPLTIVDCYAIVFVGLGLVTIVESIPQTLIWLHSSFASHGTLRRMYKIQEYTPQDVARMIIPLIIGIFLFVFGRSLALRLQRYHDPQLA
jgi:hypothetical protein